MARYVSPLREAQAAQTRQRVLDAAVATFRSSGYSGTSLARIAEEAGVSVETVKQLGPKSSLLLAAFGHAFTGMDTDLPLSEQSGLDWIRALSDEEFTPGWLGFIADANRRVAQLWPRLLEAASADAEVSTRLAALQANRRKDMDSVIALLRERGLCRSERTDVELAAELSFLISPESYSQLVIDRGWSEQAYRGWLGRAVERMILQP
ncbi:TetR family transcriptional regulator [Microbacterium sp. ARD32]|uniref:TetR/AcrR family transcriptional regulator n=1 Tax=Microbacterium sp. ARD32 TaxID=2962577 RepID=UPI0028826F2D|nr:TetR family transcriptional regulator [Microbacterium sp. ARD32]MDT0157907.1 TetR family transcriptional regulator [Microbacterium sp. ARD32]